MAQALTQFSEGRPLGCRGTSSWIALFAFTFRETYIPAGPVLAGQTTSGLASQAGWPPVVCSPPNHQIGCGCRSADSVGQHPRLSQRVEDLPDRDFFTELAVEARALAVHPR